jgi:hypothetical protein
MGNKYSSNVRTYLARNLVWNSGSCAAYTPYTLSAPNDLTFGGNDFVTQVLRGGLANGAPDWNTAGNIIIRKMGVFCQFADGLVPTNTINRLQLNLYAQVFQSSSITGTAQFTKNSNIVSGTSLTSLGSADLILDSASILSANAYKFVVKSASSVQLSDYALRNATNSNIYAATQTADPFWFYSVRIPVLNTMFDTEIIFQNSIAAGATTKAPLILATLATEPDGNFTFYTKNLDTDFNGLPVTFDAVVELEVTSNY